MRYSSSTLFLLATSGYVSANQLLEIGGQSYNPVRQDIIDQIKAKTNKWVPMELESSKFRDVSFGQM
jgi:hypothetical protein